MSDEKYKKLRGSWRWTAWDPWLLVAQMVALQALLYGALALLLAAAHDVCGAARDLDHIFAYHEVHVRSCMGRGVVTANVINAGIGALLLWLIVGRTKLCLDFTCTYYGVHVLWCWWYNGVFSWGAGWWALQAASAALTCVCAEFLCLRTELQAIPLSTIGAKVDL